MRWFLFTFAACLLVCLLRNTTAVAAPLLVWDDVLIFNGFFEGRGSLFFVYPDNISLAPNIIFLIGFELFRLPVLPAALEWMAIGLFAALSATPSLPVFANCMPDPAKRAILAIWIAAMPLNDLALIVSPDYQNWSSMIPVFLFTALMAATSLGGRGAVSPAWLALVVPCALANPLSVATAPFNALSAAAAWRRSGARAAVPAFGLLLAGLVAAGLVGVTAPARPGGAAVGAGQVADAAWKAALFTLDRGFVEALIGSPARQAILDALPAVGAGLAPAALYAVAACFVGVLAAFAARRGRREVMIFAATLVAAAFAYSFVVLLTLGPLRGVSSGDGGLLTTYGRYWYVQKVAILAALGVVLLEAPPIPARLPASATAMALGAFLLAYAANADTGSRYGLSGRADPRKADRVRRSAAQHAFLRAVQAASRRGVAGCFVEPGDPGSPLLRLVLPKGSGSRAAADAACVTPSDG